MAMSCSVIEVLKVCGQSRGTSLKILLQQSTRVTQLQCRPCVDRCSRCWLSYACQKAVVSKHLIPDRVESPLSRGLRTLCAVFQNTCKKKYDHNSTECCSDGSTKTMDCWQCGQSIDDVTERYFCDCGVVQPPVAKRSYFDVMGVKETFDIDLDELTEKYRSLQRILHPDKYSQKCDTEKQFSLQHSAIVNRAYNTLQKPLARGLYMLQLSEENLEHEMHVATSEFLCEILEVNEAISEANSPDDVAIIGAENQAKIEDLVHRISDAFKQNDTATAKELLLHLKYYSNVADRVREVLQKYVG